MKDSSIPVQNEVTATVKDYVSGRSLSILPGLSQLIFHGDSSTEINGIEMKRTLFILLEFRIYGKRFIECLD